MRKEVKRGDGQERRKGRKIENREKGNEKGKEKRKQGTKKERQCKLDKKFLV